jgi:hypothetical protein
VVAGWLGLGLHVLVGVFPYLASGLIAPGWGYPVLLAIWAALMVVAIMVFRRRPAFVALVPVAAIGVWALMAALGERFWGWGA